MTLEVDGFFARKGWTKAGGMWGDAQWKQLREDLVVAIGGGDAPGATTASTDFLDAPTNLSYPCMVFVYRAPFWNAWTVEDGECPVEDAERCEKHFFSDVYAALGLIEQIAR